MEYCRMERIVTDSIDIPDSVPFVVYTDDSKWAFAMKINKKFTLTTLMKEKAEKHEVMYAKKKIMFCKEYGWSYTGQKTWNNDTDDQEPEFICMYCKTTTYDISKPCLCRNKQVEDIVNTSPSGIILPF